MEPVGGKTGLDYGWSPEWSPLEEKPGLDFLSESGMESVETKTRTGFFFLESEMESVGQKIPGIGKKPRLYFSGVWNG